MPVIELSDGASVVALRRPFDPAVIDAEAREWVRVAGTERFRLSLPEPSVGGNTEIVRRNPRTLVDFVRERMVITRAVYLVRRDVILARLRAPRAVENPVNLDGPARCAWRAMTAGSVCEARKMRCRATGLTTRDEAR